MQFLVFNLEGPLQSWGTGSLWEFRDSGPLPTKSGVIGILASALGLERGDPRIAELHGMYRFYTSAIKPGRPYSDFQTMTGEMVLANFSTAKRQKTSANLLHQATCMDPWREYLQKSHNKDLTTKMLTKEYLVDASFLAVLEPVSGVVDEDHCKALKHPCWAAYLGRRNCVPTRPVFSGIADAESVLDWAKSTPTKIWKCESNTATTYLSEGPSLGRGRMYAPVGFKYVSIKP